MPGQVIELKNVWIDMELQPREKIDWQVVDRYAAILENGGALPHMTVIPHENAGEYYVVKGFHRLLAHWQAEKTQALVIVENLSRDQALVEAEDDNLKHGLSYSSDELKAIFIRRLNAGHAWVKASDRSVAKQLGVHHTTLARWRKEYYEARGEEPPDTRIGADGKERSLPQPSEPDPLPEPIIPYLPNADREYPLAILRINKTKRIQAKVAIAVRAGLVTEQEAGNHRITEVSDSPFDPRIHVWKPFGPELRGGPIPRPVDKAAKEAAELNRIEQKLSGGERELVSLKPDSMKQLEGEDHSHVFIQATELQRELDMEIAKFCLAAQGFQAIRGVRSLIHRGEDDLVYMQGRLRQVIDVAHDAASHATDLLDKIETMIETGEPYA